MKTIDKIEQDLRNKLQQPGNEQLLTQGHNDDLPYNYEQLTENLEAPDETNEEIDADEDMPYDFFAETQEKSREHNTFYYRVLENKVEYEIGEELQKESFYYSDPAHIEQQIRQHALIQSRIGIFKDIRDIKEAISAMQKALDENELKKRKIILDTCILRYNTRLKQLFPHDSTLTINTSLLLLPASSDLRAVQVANAVPDREGTYRRSQRSHPYHETDPDGVEIELQTLDTFLQSTPNRKGLFTLTVFNNHIIYEDADEDHLQQVLKLGNHTNTLFIKRMVSRGGRNF